MEMQKLLEQIQKDLAEAKAFRESIDNNMKDVENKYSVSNIKNYENVVQKLSKMLIYEEKGTEKNSVLDNRRKMVIKRKKRLDVHTELKIQELEQQRQRQNYLRDLKNTQNELFQKLGFEIQENDDGVLKITFHNFQTKDEPLETNDDEKTIVFDVKFTLDSKDFEVFESIPPNIVDREAVLSSIKKSINCYAALVPVLHEELCKLNCLTETQ